MDSTIIDVIVDNLTNNPHCLHGPTILFKRLRGKTKEFYACSACRDRKDCNFFIPASDLAKNSTRELSQHWKNQQKIILTTINNENRHEIYLKMLEMTNTKSHSKNRTKTKSSKSNAAVTLNVNYCYSCSSLFTQPNTNHNECHTLPNISRHQLLHPTEIVIPKTNAKTHAQYFFSQSTVNDILLLLNRLKISKVLCIGVPRIHEYITNNNKFKVESLLLDLDKNYYNFYNKDQFIWFNMFNNHVFDEAQEKYLQDYLSTEKIIILLDPPFGGRVEPLAHTIKSLSKHLSKDRDGEVMLDTFWFFPYFMEQHIVRSLPNFKMFDYKVNYENHTSFTDTGNRKRKFGSPVRIFTNVALSRLNLTGIEGYKFCTSCGYWVSNENKHCNECNACTSKDGRTYIHCEKCSKCVKPTYQHCEQCERCCLPNHVCGEFMPDLTCYHCGKPGHKKNSCPELLKMKEVDSDNKMHRKRKRIK